MTFSHVQIVFQGNEPVRLGNQSENVSVTSGNGKYSCSEFGNLWLQHVGESSFPGQIIKKNRGLFKQEVLEITFQIYPLKGTGLQSNRKSTWLNPIVDGEEAVKLSGQ